MRKERLRDPKWVEKGIWAECNILLLVTTFSGPINYILYSQYRSITISLSSHVGKYDGDQGVRVVLGNSDSTTLYFRPSVQYRAKPWFAVHGGIRFFQTFTKDEDSTFEIGPWQGLQFAWSKIGGYLFTHYLRLEERIFWTEGDGDFDFTVRTRYKLGVRSLDYDILFRNGIFLLGSIEAFRNSETPLFVNRLRFDIGVGTKISDRLAGSIALFVSVG